MPKSTHVHKSMLLRGVKPAPPALDRQDIETTKAKAAHSGRSFGGAPFRGGGRGRGGGGGGGNHHNYNNNGSNGGGDSRPNPFAAHINPGFAPPPPPPHFQSQNRGGGGGPPQGWVPPPQQGFGGGYNGYAPPLPQQGGFNGYGPPPPPPLPQHANGYYHGHAQRYGGPHPPPPQLPPQDR
ncbi:MAG: hypothetical protein L6R35_001463, partial [Caloplaca aegaea]